jgi:hypothetical protein
MPGLFENGKFMKGVFGMSHVRMTKYFAMHTIFLIATIASICWMLLTRIYGSAGHLTDVAIAMLVAGGGWHVLALRRLKRRSNG